MGVTNLGKVIPERGVDYWTAGDVSAMESGVDDSIQDALVDATTVNGSGAGDDTFACDIARKKYINFALTIADTDAKVVTFSNVPTGRCEVELEITTSAVASVTWTLNSDSTLAWSGGFAPTFESGKVYLIGFRTSDSGATWDGYATAGV